MKCLGVESTAHTFSCAVLERKGKRGEILSDVRKIYGPPEGEGIHPREASRHHVENSTVALVEALQKAKVSVTDLDIISYAAGPGLDHVCVLVQWYPERLHLIIKSQFFL